jgi:hypothetical protein
LIGYRLKLSQSVRWQKFYPVRVLGVVTPLPGITYAIIGGAKSNALRRLPIEAPTLKLCSAPIGYSCYLDPIEVIDRSRGFLAQYKAILTTEQSLQPN